LIFQCKELIFIFIAGLLGWETSLYSWWITNSQWLGKSLDNYISWG